MSNALPFWREFSQAQQGGRGDRSSTRYLLHRIERDGREVRAVAPARRTRTVRASRSRGAEEAHEESPDLDASACTPGSRFAKAVLGLSHLFVEELIATGRKPAGDRADAGSLEWLDEMEEVVLDQLGELERMERIAEVVRHAARSPAWEGIQCPATLRERFAEVERSMATGPGVQG